MKHTMSMIVACQEPTLSHRALPNVDPALMFHVYATALHGGRGECISPWLC
jgi:hypothetical protein